jgi:hypothetical protein
MTTANIPMQNYDDATLKLKQAKSLLLLLSTHYQEGTQELFNHDMDSIVMSVHDLVNNAGNDLRVGKNENLDGTSKLAEPATSGM